MLMTNRPGRDFCSGYIFVSALRSVPLLDVAFCRCLLPFSFSSRFIADACMRERIGSTMFVSGNP